MSSDFVIEESQLDDFEVQALSETEAEAMVKSYTDESVVTNDTVKFIKIPRNPRTKETVEEGKEQEGTTATHSSIPSTTPTTTLPPLSPPL